MTYNMNLAYILMDTCNGEMRKLGAYCNQQGNVRRGGADDVTKTMGRYRRAAASRLGKNCT